ncbi:unnamed protein product [Moneuplotes crassus]|uniref:Chromo domain-containing protein n=1 Tax=Euplotes crassus TaxID=5936 RepID=A0AAD2D5B2_EUPCR|nr:unnamed protein product [Moneuplotes crassus]
MEQNREEEIKDEYYQVERITKHKIVRGKKYYLIKWVGYHDRDNTWEPVENLANVTYMIEEYENKRKLLGDNSDMRSGKMKKRDRKDRTKIYDEGDSSAYAESKEQDHLDFTPSGAELSSTRIGLMDSESKKEGSFDKDQPEKIMGVVRQINCKEWLMKVKWKKDPKTLKRPKTSTYTNTELKQRCPNLLFDFYESNVISSI